MSARRALLMLVAVVAALLALSVAAAAEPEKPAVGSGEEAGAGPAEQDDDPLAPAVGPTGLYGVTSPGEAFIYGGGPPTPAIVGSGADALLRPPDLRGGNAPTLLERYGTQGYSLDQQPGVGSNTDGALNAIAGGVFAIAAWIALAVVAVVQWAFTVELFSFFADAVDGIVGALRDTVYAPFVTSAVVLAGAWGAWHGLVRGRGTRASEGLVWAVVALATAVLFFAAPGALLDGANTVSTEISRGTLVAVAVADPGTDQADELSEPTFEGHPADQQLRRAGDRFWRAFVHEPWLVLQFGDPQVGAPYAERLLDAKTLTLDELEAAGGDGEALERLTAEKQESYLALQEEVLADPRAAEWFRGRRAVERVGLATLTLVGVGLGGALMALVAIALLLAQVGLLLLVLLAPLALLVGIHPGAGRLLAVRWVELSLGLLLKRVGLGVLLAVILVVNGVLLDAASHLGWLVVVGLQTLVVAAAVVYRRPLLRLAAPTTVPVLHAREPATRRERRSDGSPEPLRLAPFTIRHRSLSSPHARPRPGAAGAGGDGATGSALPTPNRRVRRAQPPPERTDDERDTASLLAALLLQHGRDPAGDAPVSDEPPAGNGHRPGRDGDEGRDGEQR